MNRFYAETFHIEPERFGKVKFMFWVLADPKGVVNPYYWKLSEGKPETPELDRQGWKWRRPTYAEAVHRQTDFITLGSEQFGLNCEDALHQIKQVQRIVKPLKPNKPLAPYNERRDR